MVIGLDPVIVTIGPYAVRWSGMLALAGLALGIWITARAARARGLPPVALATAAAWAIPIGILAAHLAHVLGGWESYFTRPAELWRFSLDGLSLWGGIVGGGLAAAWALRDDPWVRARLADAAAPGLAFGIAIGRVGSFLDGSGQGLPTSLPWGTRYTSPAASVPDFGVARHPAQVYDGLAALAALGVVLAIPSSAPDGTRLWAFLAVYGAARVALGAVRLEAPFLLGLQLDQVLAGAAVLFALIQALRAIRAGHPRRLAGGASA